MTQVFDLSDPAQPRFIRNFGLPGQEPGARAMPVELHGPSRRARRATACTSATAPTRTACCRSSIAQKLLTGRRAHRRRTCSIPKSAASTVAPRGAHTRFPVLGVTSPSSRKDKVGKRDFVAIVDDRWSNECQEPRQMLWIADVTVGAPSGVVDLDVPEADGELLQPRRTLSARTPRTRT
jgi:hypothetical protein